MNLGLLAWLCAGAAAGPAEVAPVRFDGLTVEARWALGKPTDSSQRFVLTTLEKGGLVITDPGSPASRGGAGPRFVLAGTVSDASERRRMLFTEVEVVIDWVLRDVVTGDEVYRATTMGYAAEGGNASYRLVAYSALEDAVKRLTSRQRLFTLLEGVGPSQPVVSEAASVQVARCEETPPTLPRGLDQAARAAVTVTTASGSTGSAFLISPDGWALTAAHVVTGLDDVEVTLRSGPSLTASVVRTSDDVDAALLRIPGRAHPCLPLEPAVPGLGADLFVLGSPLGARLDVSVSRGIVSGFRTFEGRQYLQTDAAVNPGSSGGPMLDEKGGVVALTSWKVAGLAEGLGFGVPTEATLTALGIRVGDTSVVTPAITSPVPPVQPVTALERVQDVADAESRMGTLTPEIHRRVRGTGTGLVLGGLALGGLGVAMAATSYDTWVHDPTKTPGQRYGALMLNGTGWTSIAAGTTLAIWGASVLGDA